MIRWCTAPEIWCATDGQTDGRTDGWKKWHKNCDYNVIGKFYKLNNQ